MCGVRACARTLPSSSRESDFRLSMGLLKRLNKDEMRLARSLTTVVANLNSPSLFLSPVGICVSHTAFHGQCYLGTTHTSSN